MMSCCQTLMRFPKSSWHYYLLHCTSNITACVNFFLKGIIALIKRVTDHVINDHSNYDEQIFVHNHPYVHNINMLPSFRKFEQLMWISQKHILHSTVTYKLYFFLYKIFETFYRLSFCILLNIEKVIWHQNSTNTFRIPKSVLLTTLTMKGT